MRGRVGIFAAAGAAIAVALVLAALRTGEVSGALSNWQALVLGLVQGATELLPISSSGHLILVPWAAEWTYLEQDDEFNQTFDVALHLGTLVAVVAYFWRDLGRYIAAWFRSFARRSAVTVEERIAWFLFVATIPAVVVGAAGETFITEHLGEPWQIAILLAVFAVVLWIADQRPTRRHMDGLTIRDAVIIGTAQAAALAPGVSRAGLVSAPRPDHARRRRLQGPHGRRLRRPAGRMARAVRRRHAGGGRERPPCHRLPAQLRPAPHLRALRRLPPDRCRDRAARDRDRRAPLELLER
jgi:hypothetical protein